MLRFTLPAVVGLILTAAGTRADAPKPAGVDLEDLKYAVTMAEKKGENVGAVAGALAAFEQALAKSLKPGEAPPELAALRDAVEAAAKKGENVEAISKELGRIEKALTGREYERPKPPEPKLEPVPPLRRGGRGGVVIGGGFNGRGRVVIGGADGFNFNSITISNGNYTLKARQNDVTYTITGMIDGNEVPKIVIQAGEKKIEADDVKKVPEEYRAQVEKMLKQVSR